MEEGVNRIQDHQRKKKADVNTDTPEPRHRACMNLPRVRLVDCPDTAGKIDYQRRRNQRKNKRNAEGEEDIECGNDGLVGHFRVLLVKKSRGIAILRCLEKWRN